MEQNEEGERRGEKVASIKKGARNGVALLSVARGRGEWRPVGPRGPRRMTSRLLLLRYSSSPLFQFLSLLRTGLDLHGPCMYYSTATEQKNLDSSSLSWIEPAWSILRILPIAI